MQFLAIFRNHPGTCCAGLLLATLLLAPQARAQNAAQEQDLEATLSLLGQPCGKVTAVTVQGGERLVTCSNGARYRIHINAQGRVVAEKR
jgi:hypothetical protein